MPLPSPPIALLNYRQLVRETLERVPSHTPEWTNLNDSDPGVTLVQLFAFLTEALSYRANLIPERNRLKFLQLLGVPMRPAQPAQGLVAFSNPKGPPVPTTIASETEITAGKVPFRTLRALTVLPLEGRLYRKAEIDDTRKSDVEVLYERLYGDLAEQGIELDYYETRPFDPPTTGVTLSSVNLAEETVDGSLWLALMARPGDTADHVSDAIASKILTLAVLPALDDTEKEMPPIRDPSSDDGAGFIFDIPVATGQDVRYQRLEARPTTELALHPGTVELTLPDAELLRWVEDFDPLEPGVGELPPSLADTEDGTRLVTWIRIRPREGAARLSGVWVNGAEVIQRAWVDTETLPLGTGEPHQRAVLVNTPVLPETLSISVNGVLWQPIDEIYEAAPEIPTGTERLAGGAAVEPTKVSPEQSSAAPATSFTIDPESGEIRFGDGFHGARPPRGATIIASYAYGGGRQGVVGIDAISKGPSLPAGIKISNPAPTWGGNEPESVTDAEHRTPKWLRHRDRLVAADDFREIAWGTPGVDMGRVEVLPLYHPQLGSVPADGAVTLLVIPLVDPSHPDNPEPDRLFLDAVCRHLEPRRLVTTELYLTGPSYRDLLVSVGVEVMPEYEQGPVLERAEIEIRRFLSPLAGGFGGLGWPLDKTVEPGDVLAAVARVDGVARVNKLLLGNLSGSEIASLAITDLDLPRLAGVSVVTGEPILLADLLGTPETEAKPRRVPVPVIPEEC